MSNGQKTSPLNATVLVVDDDRAVRRTMEMYLTAEGHTVLTAVDGNGAWKLLERGGIDVCLLDLGLPGMSGLELLAKLSTEWGSDKEPPSVIIVSVTDDMATTVEAIKLGAYDYLVKPADASRIKITVQRALEQRRTSMELAHFIARQQQTDHELDKLIGKSEAMREVYKRIGAVSASPATVLVRGESGTGKELVARAIHQASSVSHEPFVAINCTAFPPDLLESELFGHVRGAFTGAVSDKVGRFQLAGQGTLFLDEIGELRPELQAKLLRVLQERTFERVGDVRSVVLAARVIAATHRDLEQMLRQGTFREDLYYRLRVVEIYLPALRDRPEDIPLLVDHLLSKITRQTGKQHVRFVSSEAMDAITRYRWPGNVRELENALTRAVVLCKGEVLSLDVLPSGIARCSAAENEPHPPSIRLPSQQETWLSLKDMERAYIIQVLLHTGWHKRKACAILQITRPTLDRKIKEYSILRPT